MSKDRRNTIVADTIDLATAKAQIIEIGTTERLLPAAGIFDEPTRCYRANLEWTPLIMGMVHWLADVTAWRDAEDEGYQGIREILRFMQGEDCMTLQLRQKPTDACVLQQSLDGGDTWQDVFDFSLCVTIQDKSYQVSIQNQVINNAQTFQDIYNNYTTNYSGLPSDVHANLAVPTGDDSAYRAALCNALFELVNKACDSAVSFYTEVINQAQSEANFFLAVAAFTFTAIALAAAIPSAGTSLVALAAIAPEIALGVGLGAGLANYLVDFWQTHTIDQFQDSNAIETVTCFLFDCLDGSDVSLDDVQNCVAGTITDDANAQAILDYLQILLEHDSTYAAFLEKWSNNTEFADAGINLHCPCLSGYKVWVWDFANGMGDFEFAIVAGVPCGSHEGGRVKSHNFTSSNQIQLITAIDPTWRFVCGRVEGERVGGGGAAGDINNIKIRPTPNSNSGAHDLLNSTSTPTGAYDVCEKYTTAPQYITNGQQMLVRETLSSGTDGDWIYIDRITILYQENFAKGGYITDDDDICT